MIANRIKPVLIALVCFLFASGLAAGERRHPGHHRPHAVAGSHGGHSLNNRHRRHVVENSRWDRHGDRRRDRHRNRPPRIQRTDGFAGGSFSRVRYIHGYDNDGALAYPNHASGTYFLRDRQYWGQPQQETLSLAPTAKIIHVDSSFDGDRYSAGNGCSYEAGVCVIRGGR